MFESKKCITEFNQVKTEAHLPEYGINPLREKEKSLKGLPPRGMVDFRKPRPGSSRREKNLELHQKDNSRQSLPLLKKTFDVKSSV